MAFPGNYHADSDADDEYERSVFHSPMPPTDDETSSTADSDPGSHDHTPTTFDGPDYDRKSPRVVISSWTKDDCVGFLTNLGLDQYGRAFRENEITGDSMIRLKHEEFKEMGIVSVGHRLTILKGIYDMKIKQNVPVEPEDYIPLSAEDNLRNTQATQDDIARILHVLGERERRMMDAESELRRMQDEYKKLREELLPLWKMAKERNESLPSPVFQQNNNQSSLGRKPSKNNKNLYLGPGALKNPSSPTYHSSGTPDTILNPSTAVNTATTYLAHAIAGIDINTSPNISSPGASPGVPQPLNPTQTPRYGSVNSMYQTQNDPYMSGTTLGSDTRPSTATTYVPSMQSRRAGANSIRETPIDDGKNPPAVEVFKSFRVSLDDPCYKVLPAALKKYNIQADWRQYALYIVYGDQERCLGLEEKPLILFKQLDKEGRKPMFMLRRHVAPVEGHTRSTAGDNTTIEPPFGGRNASQIQLPGGVL